MVVQREDTTEMETILLEEVYQSRYIKLELSKLVVWIMSSNREKLYNEV
jgi:hypothetical protein